MGKRDWTIDKKWSDKFLPKIKMILGLHLISESIKEEDCERNTDLTVLKLDAIRIACRVRKYKYHLKYPKEFTLRSKRPVNNKSELAKIIEGWGDYFFYGFSNEQENDLVAWYLLDLTVFRLWFAQRLVLNKGCAPGIEKANHDNSSKFRVFQLADMPKNLVLVQGGNHGIMAF